MTMKTIKINDFYTLKIHALNTNTNANQAANVYKTGEKYPITGTIFSDNTKITEIKQWAINTIEKLSNCEHINARHFHDNAPRYCPDCNQFLRF